MGEFKLLRGGSKLFSRLVVIGDDPYNFRAFPNLLLQRFSEWYENTYHNNDIRTTLQIEYNDDFFINIISYDHRVDDNHVFCVDWKVYFSSSGNLFRSSQQHFRFYL